MLAAVAATRRSVLRSRPRGRTPLVQSVAQAASTAEVVGKLDAAKAVAVVAVESGGR